MKPRIRVKLKPREKEFLREVVRRWVKDWPVGEYGEPHFTITPEDHGGFPIYDWVSTKWDGDAWKSRWVFASPTVDSKPAGIDHSHSDHFWHYKDYDFHPKRRLIQSFDRPAHPNRTRLKHSSEF